MDRIQNTASGGAHVRLDAGMPQSIDAGSCGSSMHSATLWQPLYPGRCREQSYLDRVHDRHKRSETRLLQHCGSSMSPDVTEYR